ncbi:response regulator [Burkholderia contaminans]|uniref:response regulator transcription factor n=1 Tax=Burkholderia contaminans TaxID=488447 RepID=UPI000F591C7D|nr:response regulator [Burkholderia contaminans]ELK6461701.1 response regulator [Burkholderia contaminans]RQT05913.1 response regulator [Burkholderia contaminans]
MPFSLSASDLVSIVDDDPFVRAAAGSFVRSLGGEAREFASGPAFLASDVVSRTGCLICDLQMPEMDGLEVLAEMEARSLHIPTVLVTAFVSARAFERARASTALCLLEKPIDAQELEGWLARALGYG